MREAFIIRRFDVVISADNFRTSLATNDEILPLQANAWRVWRPRRPALITVETYEVEEREETSLSLTSVRLQDKNRYICFRYGIFEAGPHRLTFFFVEEDLPNQACTDVRTICARCICHLDKQAKRAFIRGRIHPCPAS